MMHDMLHRRRMHFSRLGARIIQRMLDEAIDHCKNRFVGGKDYLAIIRCGNVCQSYRYPIPFVQQFVPTAAPVPLLKMTSHIMVLKPMR
ncbi:MAG: hypothetical protein V2I31_00455 [Mariniphaga sp.]|nr:hypothetical protein [Mariniphaga sp.]